MKTMRCSVDPAMPSEPDKLLAVRACRDTQRKQATLKKAASNKPTVEQRRLVTSDFF
jgi:hypothetical protein